MITFLISLVLLVLGYLVYGRFVERVFGPDDRITPAIRINDGVDYIVLPSWKVFMIQFLNIAGTGPIFGAIMGMWYGPAAYLWIVFGCIFAGATHDFLSGAISLRKGGIGLPEMIGEYMGPNYKKLVLVFSLFLLIMVGAVFVLSPATLLAGMMPEGTFSNLLIWIVVIFAYYVIATMMPVDKIIGKIYPLFAISLLFMGLGLLVVLLFKFPQLPEIWDGLEDMGSARLGIKNADPLIPALFITIACGAISGFHATQSPLMARCMKSERLARPIFYGSMITEGIIALVWATVSSWFFYNEGWREVCNPEVIASFTGQSEKTITQFFAAPKVVMTVCNGWLGTFGGILAVLGVVAAPITSGDTALRSARLIVADALKMDQKPIIKRLMISLPLFIITLALLVWQMDNPDSFNVIWKYFGLANQSLAIFTLWTITVYLSLKGSKHYFITLIPAVFMTWVCISFLCVSKQALGLDPNMGYFIGIIGAVIATLLFYKWYLKEHKRIEKKRNYMEERRQRALKGEKTTEDIIFTKTPITGSI
ncbi:MAG: carbon starvation protein A [Prevotella sp.]|nr:carbon starvation protein A [Prevotella sp.]